VRLGWSVGFGPFRLGGTIFRTRRRRKRRRAPARRVWHGQVTNQGRVVWTCPHNHSRPDLADACSERELKRRRAAR
jgi:hypothetical protein